MLEEESPSCPMLLLWMERTRTRQHPLEATSFSSWCLSQKKQWELSQVALTLRGIWCWWEWVSWDWNPAKTYPPKSSPLPSIFASFPFGEFQSEPTEVSVWYKTGRKPQSPLRTVVFGPLRVKWKRSFTVKLPKATTHPCRVGGPAELPRRKSSPGSLPWQGVNHNPKSTGRRFRATIKSHFSLHRFRFL